jgi:hypothetical protein
MKAPRTAILQRADAERIAAGNDQTLVTANEVNRVSAPG